MIIILRNWIQHVTAGLLWNHKGGVKWKDDAEAVKEKKINTNSNEKKFEKWVTTKKDQLKYSKWSNAFHLL